MFNFASCQRGATIQPISNPLSERGATSTILFDELSEFVPSLMLRFLKAGVVEEKKMEIAAISVDISKPD